MSLFAFNPEDFPDVPTRKALIAIDLQNDFLAEDGLLPVKQPVGMVDRIIRLADAVRSSGYGEIIWVRSQFDASRPVGDQLLMAADTPQPPARTGQSAATVAAAHREKPGTAKSPLEADLEAFLSLVQGPPAQTQTQTQTQKKPECVRKGTKGAELHPAFARAKDPGDYVMTKSYYSAFESGQLLNLLRRQFATELYICGSLSNVSVYATALAATSHGFAITIVEDCCGYRSEMRHMNAARSLMEQTGCRFANAAELIPTLRPRSPPIFISSGKIAAEIAESKAKQSGKPVRPKPTPTPPQNLIRHNREDEEAKQEAVRLSTPSPLLPSSSPSPIPDLASAVKRLKLSTPPAEPSNVSETSHEKASFHVSTSTVQFQNDSPQPKDQRAFQSLVTVMEPDGRDPHSAPEGNKEADTASERQMKSAAAPCPAIASIELLVSSPDPDPEAGMIPSQVASKPVVSKPLCEGDTTLTENFLPRPLIDGLFERLCEEVQFEKMMHQGGEVPRSVAVQGHVDADGTQPLYRHPSDESPHLQPFTPTVLTIREQVAKALGHPLNHVLIQCYRNGDDCISEHSDKTLDIVRGSYIANLSLGAQRTMIFRAKRGDKKDSTTPTKPGQQTQKTDSLPVRQSIRCPMPHNSLIKMGLLTNEKWLHAIKPDKRPQVEKSTAELAWRGTRISLTFRSIGTYLTPEQQHPASSSSSFPEEAGFVIWGQGATSKTREQARRARNGQTSEAMAMLRAFSRENNSPAFEWDAHYSTGFDIIHTHATPRLFASGDSVVDGRVRLMLAEVGIIKYAHGGKTGHAEEGTGASGGSPVRFDVDDAERTTVVGDVAILLYLDARHPRKRRGGDAETARMYTRLQASLALGTRWREAARPMAHGPVARRREQAAIRTFKTHLVPFDRWMGEMKEGALLIAGGEERSVADCALWPVLHDIAVSWKQVAEDQGVGMTVFGYLGLNALDAYYRSFARRESVLRVFGAGDGCF